MSTKTIATAVLAAGMVLGSLTAASAYSCNSSADSDPPSQSAPTST